MPMLSRITSYLRNIFAREKADHDLDDEVRSCSDLLAQEKMREGVSPQQASRQAILELGGVEQVKEQVREARAGAWLDSLLQDLRYGARMLRKNPAFTAIAVLTLALGIGANTAIFTMMNGLMLHTLPVRAPGQLVELLHHYPGEPEPGFNGFSWDAYRIIRDGNHVFSDLFVGSANVFTVSADNLQPQTVFGGEVGGTFFEALGLQAAAGRLIGPEDVHMGDHAPVAVVSWSFWKSRFDLDPGIIGKEIVVGDAPVTIIGVAQRGFYGLSNEARQDIWMPISLGPSPGWGFGLLARLKPGVSLQQARVEMAVLFQTVVNAPEAGPFVRDMKLRIEPAGNGVTTPLSQMLSTPLKVLMATVGLLLLLACANLAGLLLARGVSRHHEMAVRVCLGAARSRLLRQMLTESLLLSLVGCALGIFLAYFAVHALIRVFASGRFIMGLPMHFEALTSADTRVLLFTGAIALFTGLLFGAAPAMSASKTAPASALQQAARTGESKSRQLFGKSLVASQVALSLVLVSSAGLFVEYLSHLRNRDLGFERNNLLLVTLDFAPSGYNVAQFSRLSQELVMRLDAIPGISSATFSDMSPMEGPGASTFAFAENHPEKRAQASINYVAPDYFETYGTPFLAGRDFSARDQAGSPVAIVNQAAARNCFGNENPIGGHITLSHTTLANGEETYEVVGVVEDAKYNDLQQPAPPTIYEDLLQQSFIGSQLAIRTRIDPGGAAGAVRQTEAAVLKTVPIVQIMTMNQQIDSSIVPQRLIATLSASFGALGALLAAIGLYGLLAYIVVGRTHEIGVRMALGATRSDIMRMVLRDVLWTVSAGLALGIPLVSWARRVITSLVFDLPTKSPISLVFGVAVMIALGFVAAYIPAHRAMRVDPMIALRHE